MSDATGATQLRLPGVPRYGWGTPPQGGNRDRRIFVAFRTDQRALHTIPIVDYSSPLERVTYSNYPKTGTPLPVTELHIVDPAAATTRPVKLDTRDAYVFFLGWRRTVSDALVMRMSRSGKRLELFAIEAGTGATRLLAYDERPATFVAALDFSTADWQWQVIPLPDDSGFLWMSERDGWRHVYHYGYDGALKKQVTSGAFRVHRVARVDSARVGHSWGGYFALRGMLIAPDFFKVGYAGAPGDLTEAASINEPNMGLLTSNKAGYDAGSNIERASALRGRLKIMHGTSDPMAPLSNTMRMAQALIEANKTFDLLIMPGQPHGPRGAAGRYYREDVRRFMATHLLRHDASATSGRPVPE
ncbi:MAG: S9 family peptidase [Acidobacteriota bacterium]|nr:S9 family peptidase [Acidobacteriota bacterium]